MNRTTKKRVLLFRQGFPHHAPIIYLFIYLFTYIVDK